MPFNAPLACQDLMARDWGIGGVTSSILETHSIQKKTKTPPPLETHKETSHNLIKQTLQQQQQHHKT